MCNAETKKNRSKERTVHWEDGMTFPVILNEHIEKRNTWEDRKKITKITIIYNTIGFLLTGQTNAVDQY